MADERTILITGSTDGLGQACAADLAAEGAMVLLHGRDERRVQAAAEVLKARNVRMEPGTLVADLSSLEEVRHLADRVRSEYEHLDVLVNNAGVALPGSERQSSSDGYELTFAV